MSATNIIDSSRVTTAPPVLPTNAKFFAIRDGMATINLADWPFLLGDGVEPVRDLEVHFRSRAESRWLGSCSFTLIRASGGNVDVKVGAVYPIAQPSEGHGGQSNRNYLADPVAGSSPPVARQSAEVRRLTLELTRVEQRERKRLAELLHDHLQQLLVAARLRIHLIGSDATTPAAQGHAVQAQTILEEAIEVTRTLAAELCPLVVTQLGLAEGLKWLGNWIAKYHGLNVRVSASPQANPAAQEVQVLLFQSVRELLFNAVKHARAHEAAVHQHCINDRTGAIVVTDRGQGFDPTAPRNGMGLSMTRQRLEAIGGSLELRSVPGKGTRLEMRYPLT